MDDSRHQPSEGESAQSQSSAQAHAPAPGTGSQGIETTVRAPSAEALEARAASGPAFEAEGPDPLLGQTLAGRYTLLELLGAGGMSVVYLARHELLKKLVAVKLLRHDIAGNKESMSRFHREAMAAASIGDPHIVDVTDYGFTESGEAFLVMERLDGEDLRHILVAEGALETGRAIAITRQILRALQAAHGRGIVHRDLKAENVFLTRRDGHDFVKLLDFGISKALQPLPGAGGTAATGTGVVMGTPQYIAPEQAHGSPDVDHRVDLYSLGVILYEMLTGSLPFSGASALEVLMKHVQEEPQPPRQRRPDLDIPVELERVVLKALAKDPAQRFPSAEAMLAALPDPLTLPGGFRSSGSLPPARPGAVRRRWLLPAGAGALLVAALGALLIVELRGAEDRGARRGPLRRPAAGSSPRVIRPPLESRPPAARPASAPARAEVRVTILPQPPSAEVWLGGRSLGQGKVVTQVPQGELPLAFTLRAEGFAERIVEVTPDRDQEVPVRLARRKPGVKKKPGGKEPAELKSNPYKQ